MDIDMSSNEIVSEIVSEIADLDEGKDTESGKNKVLELLGLSKIYKNKRGVFDLNLEIYEGEVFGFLGPNGAGKTTAMKLMTGMMRPDEGDTRIFGHSLALDYEKAMSRVGSIVEFAQSYPYLTAYENLKLISKFYENIGSERIDEVLDIIGLHKYKNEKVSNFSLGMKQRLGIGLAILSRPGLVILDEPLNGMDVEGMVTMRRLIRGLAEKEKVTFFISSHLIHDIELTCNRVGVIFDGKILDVGYTAKILENHDSLESYFMSEVDKHGKL